MKLKKIIFMLKKFRKDLKANRFIPFGDVAGTKLNKYYIAFKEDPGKLNALIADFDEDGVPLNTTYIDVEEKKLHYYPISIGQYALAIFHSYLDHKEEEKKAHFLRIAEWFFTNRIEDENLGVYWLTDVPKPEYQVEKPWESGFSQSRGLSVLLRAWQLTNDDKYLEAAKKALLPFTLEVSEGGVAVDLETAPFYEEYVAEKPTKVLDGCCFCLFGIYDAVRAIRPEVDAEAHHLAKTIFDKGIKGLVKRLPDYDMGYWMKFNLCELDFYPQNDPCTIGYLRLIRGQLDILYKITGQQELKTYADKMKHYDRLPNIVKMYKQKFAALRKMNRL